jgi:endonuclease
MNKYSSIKQLVIDETLSKGELPSLETLTILVKENFPNSKWQKSHYDWYKSQIKNGKIDIGTVLESSDQQNEDIITTESLNEFAISLERDLQNYLADRIEEIETGLKLLSIEFGTSAGFIDILATDVSGNIVIIELKAGKVKDAALGQILGYIGAYQETENVKNVRGILVGAGFDNRVFYASKALTNIKLVKYSINFKFDIVSNQD